MLRVKILTVGPIQTNCFIAWDEGHEECIVVDPGYEGDRILLEVARLNLKVKYIYLTHGHVDHIGAAEFLKSSSGAEICAHHGDKFLMKTGPLQAPLFGMKPFKPPGISRIVEEGDRIILGNLTFEVKYTPGHSPGSTSLLTDGAIFVGDLIFMDSIGRTDLPGGDFETLLKSVREKIFSLPDETVIYPGHGPQTTVGREKKLNPFF